MQNSSDVNTRSFNKGMVKDLNDTYTGEGTWTHARNAVNNSEYGDIGVLGNEPANLKCVDIPFKVIGSISLGGGYWAIYSTERYGDYVTPAQGSLQSEIGLFNENDCSYNTIVNDKLSQCKLNFDQLKPIIGVSKTNSDCSVQLYWDDGLNPSRSMNIGDPAQWPYTINEAVNPPLHWGGVPYEQRDIDNDPDCKNLVDTLNLDCDALRLAPLIDTPCITISKGEGLGTLPNGTYQATIAYTVNQIRVTDYLAFSNLQPLWTHENLTGSIDIDFDNLDADYDEFELVIISSINQQTVCKRIGVYSTNTKRVSLDAINADLQTIPIEQIPVRTPAYEKTDAMYAVNDYLIRVGPTTKFDFNYQPLANQITTKWVATYYPSDYYYKGGNKPSFMRDEVYSFFIRWVYNTGDKSLSYHIPGRPAIPNRDLYSVGSPDGDNGDGAPIPRWRVESTATITDRPVDTRTEDGGLVFAKGQMGYWESTERYPDNKPDIWGDLCGKPIRHHKMPEDFIYDDQRRSVEQVKLYNNDFDSIAILGVEFDNIPYPVDNDGKGIPGIVGYEILVGSREGHRSIIAKGLINNMREYTIPDEERTGLYVNYPYNSTKPDPFLAIDRDRVDVPYKQSKGGNQDDDNFYDTDQEGDLILFGNTNDTTLFGVRNDIFSFHSPETTFRNPFLSATELRVYADVNGDVKGKFIPVEDHPKAKLITDVTFLMASLIGAVIGKSAADEADGGFWGSVSDFFNVLTATAINPALGAAVYAKQKIEEAVLFSYFFVESTDNVMEGIKGFSKFRQYALQYISHGFYERFEAVPINERRRILTKSNYLQPSLQDFTEEFRINNISRSKTVVIKAKQALSLYREYNNGVEENTLFTVKHIAKNRAGRTRPSGYDSINDAENAVYKQPWAFPQTSLTIAKYGALKIDLENQYGQLEQIKQVPVGCIQLLSTPFNVKSKFQSGVLFGGDVYINRYTEKNTFFYFNNWMENLPDGTEYDYRLYNMLPYPRYWIDTTTFDTANFFSSLIPAALNPQDPIALLPNDLHHLDRKDRTSGMFVIKNAYFYLFNSGIRDFYVESEINLALRDYEDDPGKRHYDFQTYSDYERMFNMEYIREINYYKYDYSLSKVKYYSNFISWGTLQQRSYDPYVSETCFTYLRERVIYSLQQQYELQKDNWRQFLANNYYDFNSRVVSMRSIGGTGAIMMFESESPVIIQGQEQINLNSGTALTIGDGGLFNNQPIKNLVNVDDELEYASCQSRLSVLNTPAGVFYVSADQGRVFNFGQGLQDVSKAGMKWWFQEYTPFKILEDFPDFELLDNTVVGVGITATYHNDDEVIYFSKRDFKLKPEYKGVLSYHGDGIFRRLPRQRNIFLGDPTFFEDASWTVSYDVKTKSWISFHDWHPNFTMSGRKTFFTVKGKTIWKHNDRCDLYANFYDTNYPFEIEYIQNQGQEVTTTRNIEYALECYKYDQECYDKYHILNENFDRAVIYNSEQMSGELNLVLSPVSAYAQLSYPIINPASIDILYSKEEQKYRFNQFWDITNDRAVQIPMWDTEANGYIRNINPSYVNYNKGATERKKFRHYVNKVLLRKLVSGSSKFLFKVINNKLLKSFR